MVASKISCSFVLDYKLLSGSLINIWGKQRKLNYFRSHKARHKFSYYKRVQRRQVVRTPYSDRVKEDTWHLFESRALSHVCSENHAHLSPASFNCYPMQFLWLCYKIFENKKHFGQLKILKNKKRKSFFFLFCTHAKLYKMKEKFKDCSQGKHSETPKYHNIFSDILLEVI